MSLSYHAVLTGPGMQAVCIWGSLLKPLKAFSKALLTASASATQVLFFDEHDVEVDHLTKEVARANAAGR